MPRKYEAGFQQPEDQELLATALTPEEQQEQAKQVPEEATVETEYRMAKDFESRLNAYEKTKKSPVEVYNFPLEFYDLESNMIYLVNKLKDSIETGVYDILISDEVSGRIPTLIIREVIKMVAKKQAETKIPATFFLTFGKGMIDRAELEKFMANLKPENKKALIVTECIDTFRSLAKAVQALEDTGFSNFDIATASVSDTIKDYESEKIVSNNSKRKIFRGLGGEMSSPIMYSTSPILGGIEKEADRSQMIGIHPRRLDKLSHSSQASNYLRKYNNDRLPIMKKKWTQEEVQKNINAARQDVKKLAQTIFNIVWGDEFTK